MKGKILMTLFLAITSLQMFAQEPQSRMKDTSSQFYHYLYDCGCHNHPVNNYSGLNSLRARLADRSWNGNDSINGGHYLSFSSRMAYTDAAGLEDKGTYGLANSIASSGLDGNDSKYKDMMAIMEADSDMDTSIIEYMESILKGGSLLGSPVYVFFKIGTTQLTDPSQMVNVDAIAETAKRWHLKVRITGAADSATGSSDANMTLSGKRASYIADRIKNRGVEQDKIEILYEGGINSLSPVAANRHCRIELMM